MTEPPYPDSQEPRGMPRWVKVFGIIVAILAIVVVAILIFGGGEHGPGRHLSSSAMPALVLRGDAVRGSA